jgi:nitrogen fixation protein NifU and related proteins
MGAFERGLRTKSPTSGAKNAPEMAQPLQSELMYSPRLLDHFQHPRNAGEVADAQASALIENPVCGDVLRLSLKVDLGRISEIRFKAKGCVPSIACASALTELATGATLNEARALDRDRLIAAVGGLPQASTHAAQLALDALSAALRQLER